MDKTTKRDLAIILGAILLAVASLSLMGRLHIDSSTDVFIPKKEQVVAINDKIEEEKASLEIYNFSNETIFDTKKIHFAMSGLWHYNNEGHVHRIDDADKIVNWLRGLLEHVKCELSS